MFDAIWSGVFTLCINIAKSAVRVYIFAVTCHYSKLPGRKLGTPYSSRSREQKSEQADVILSRSANKGAHDPLCTCFGGEILHQHFSAVYKTTTSSTVRIPEYREFYSSLIYVFKSLRHRHHYMNHPPLSSE